MVYGEGGFRGGGGGFRKRSFGPREMTKITCSECGKEAEVPFKPRNDTPVYCRECFFKKKGIKPRAEGSAESEEAEPKDAEPKDAESKESEESEESEEAEPESE